MIDDVVAFLRAAHEEIERVAMAAIEECGGNAPWTDGVTTIVFTPTRADEGTWDGTISTTRHRAHHIALHDPRSALARVQAERTLLDRFEMARTQWRPAIDAWLKECDRIDEEQGEDAPHPEPPRHPPFSLRELEEVVRALAYGHRHTVPGWRKEWTPEGVSADA